MAHRVRKVTYALFGNVNSYIVIFSDTNEVVLVDCFKSYRTVKEFCDKHGLRVASVFITHGHIDHIADGWLWKKEGAKVYMSEADADYLSSDLNLAAKFRLPYTRFEADVLLKGGEKIDFHGHEIECIACPGHTRGGMSYYIEGMIFTGDTLFADSVGRTDFYGGDFVALLNSVKKIISLPKDTIVYPGHGGSATVAEILDNNPYVRSLDD